MPTKNIIILVCIISVWFGLPCCSTYSFNVKKNNLVNIYQRGYDINGDNWGIFFVVDEDQMKEFIADYREMKTAENVTAEKKEQPSGDVPYIFNKYQYLIFYIPSDMPQKQISDKFKFSLIDAQGNPIAITDSLFFIYRDDPDEKTKFEYRWMLQFEKPLDKINFSKDKTPFEFTIENSNHTSAKILMSY